MVRCKLGAILGDRDISVTTAAKATGISRTTLTALRKNKCKGVSFRTLDVLCSYLGIMEAEPFAPGVLLLLFFQAVQAASSMVQ